MRADHQLFAIRPFAKHSRAGFGCFDRISIEGGGSVQVQHLERVLAHIACYRGGLAIEFNHHADMTRGVAHARW